MCVTGGGGFIGSWITRFLLQKGYAVRATVRSTDPAALAEKYPHLSAWREAYPKQLTLHAADLLVPGSFNEVLSGCTGVIHAASPFFFSSAKPEEELIRPAVEGTQNVCRSAIATPSVRRVVMTSSVAAVYITSKPADHWYTEDDWSEPEKIRATPRQWYAESKLLAEREAWRIFKEEIPQARRASGKNPIDLITVCPTQTLGPLLQPTLNQSVASILELMDGSKGAIIPNKCKAFVDVRDVAMIHISALETPSASGRYLAIAGNMAWRTVCDILRKTIPGAAVPTEVEKDSSGCVTTPYPQALASVRKVANDLGIYYSPLEDSLRDCALSLMARGYLDKVVKPLEDKRQTPTAPVRPM